MLDIEIDSFWCSKCQKLHPYSKWHEKYDDYLPQSFGAPSALIYAMEGVCVKCGSKTHFKNKKTNNYVCSNECFYL